MRYLLMSLRPNDVALLKLGRGNDTLRRTDWRIEGPGVLCAFHGDDGEVHWRGWRLFVYALQFNTFIARGERSRKTRSLGTRQRNNGLTFHPSEKPLDYGYCANSLCDCTPNCRDVLSTQRVLTL